MTYKEFIDDIINIRGYDGICGIYHEYHHIIPRCLGGTDDKSNLVSLTSKEHFIAHKLLVEENPNNISLMGALVMVTFMRSNNQERYIPTKEEYKYVKAINKQFVSLTQKQLLWCYHLDTHQLRRFKLDKIPVDYVLGLPPEYEGPTKGKKMSDESKQKLSQSKIGKYLGKEWFNNGDIEILVYNCPEGFIKGRLPFSEETKKHMSESFTGKKLSQETKEKVSKSKIGKHVYNNGIITIRAYDCPEGFKPGFLKNDKLSNCKFYTNGEKTIKVYDGDIIPEGYYLGMAKNDKLQDRKWFTNGYQNRLCKDCPEGYYLGRTSKKK